MPRDAPKPAAFEPAWLQRSLDRHYTWGLVFMVVLILGFVLYGIQEPTLRANAAREQQATYCASWGRAVRQQLRLLPRPRRYRR